jgi:membrane protein
VRGQVARFRQFLERDLWDLDPGTLSPLAGFGVRALRLVAVIAGAVREQALNLRAMSLVYTTLLSLVPFLAVMFSVLKAFGAHHRAGPLLEQILEPLGDAAPEITLRVVAFVDNLQVGILGAFGLAGLFLTAVSTLGKVEDALNHVWHVRRSRSLGRKFTDYLSALLVGPVLVFSAFGLIASAQSHWLVQRVMALEPIGGLLLVVAGRMVPFVLLTAAFTLLYRFVPYTHVRLRSAMVGGATAALLWQLAGFGFTAFVASSTSYTAIYSGFAVLVLFLLWLYVAWLIVLVGAEAAYFDQYPSAYVSARRRQTHLWRERAALAALAEITRCHLRGAPPPRAAALSAEAGVPLATLEQLVDDLVSRGILLRAAEPQGLALARPPEQVTILEVLHIVSDPPGIEVDEREERHAAIAALLEAREEGLRRALGGLTLMSLVEGDRSCAEARRRESG